ncbi:MAG TPA: hypothetical protein VGS07_15965 [Thermoanaerobaculia bacterium]|nr:hypothetical protein [Thermoanaerobaculia bacterium]
MHAAGGRLLAASGLLHTASGELQDRGIQLHIGLFLLQIVTFALLRLSIVCKSVDIGGKNLPICSRLWPFGLG